METIVFKSKGNDNIFGSEIIAKSVFKEDSNLLLSSRLGRNVCELQNDNYFDEEENVEESSCADIEVKNDSDLDSLQGESFFLRSRSDTWETIKKDLHSEFLSQIDFEAIKGLSEQKLNERLRHSIHEFVSERIPSEFSHYGEQMERELEDELVGLGPLEPLIRDKSITEIMVNGASKIYVEKKGILERSNQRFRNEQHLRIIIERIVSKVGRRVDESTPVVSARLSDGSRVNAVIPPLALDGSLLTIRRFPECPLTADDLIRFDSMSEEMVDFLRSAVNGGLNIVVSGGTGSGKTTLLNIVSSFISPLDRIVTIEDSAELQLQQEHVVRMETRMPNVEGKGEFTIRDLVKNALRMRPDRIVIGECRAGEAFDMLQAMNTGHDGSLTTLHANTPSDAISRFTAMVLMSGINIPEKVIRHQIASAIDLIVQVERLPDGSRKVTHISEIEDVSGDTPKTRDIFKFEGKADKPGGKVVGRHKVVTTHPACAKKLLARGELLNLSSINEGNPKISCVYAFNDGKLVKLDSEKEGTPYRFGLNVKFLIPRNPNILPGDSLESETELTEEANGEKVLLIQKILKDRSELFVLAPHPTLHPGEYTLNTPLGEYKFSACTKETKDDDFSVTM